MARTYTRRPKKAIPINSSVALDDPPTTPFDSEPPKTSASPPIVDPPKIPTFIERMNKVEKADWGPRANIYLYRVEPVIDRTRSGELKYIMQYQEPVTEDRIMADCGSGRYKLILNFRKPGASQGDTIDAYYMDILNMKYPPKIPIGEWVDDPKNAKWAWAKQAATVPPPPAAGVNPMEALNTFMDIQDRIEERIKPPAPAAPPAPPAPPDPFDTAKKIMDMRANDPMVTILQQQISDHNKAIEAERERQFKAAESARQREFDLQQKLAESRTPAAPARGLVEQIVELAGVAEKLGPLKGLFGIANGSNGTAAAAAAAAEDTVIHTKKFGAVELFLTQTIPELFKSPLAQAAAAKWMSAPPLQQQPVNGTRPVIVQQPQQPASDPFQRFITEVATPAMLEHFGNGASGAEFASWVDWGFPQWLPKLQNFSHPGLPGLIGATAIVTAYKNTPDVWPHLAAKEAEFTQFISEFCAWRPPDEEPEPVEASAADEDGWMSEREERPL